MKKKKKKLNREAYLEKKKAKARINKAMGELKSPFLTEDLLERMAEKNMTKYQKVRRQINTERIMKVAKEHGEEAAGALMMDMMGLSDNPLSHYLIKENLGDADIVNSVSKALVNALDEERTELRSVLPKEGTIGPITGERVPVEKE